ncbi:hypothetical protein [Bosea sp. (in: a-proteobacteria)]|uniref:hypothetical protein n=1 Tax=Bosea sp. (in: a-proteobacteria) TaxID=1871050 RepID=UPI002DDD98D3|nr:hypothetical protein [Bosea sp. (in: a-proteobacteria)]HEV2512918.1 hypothetical protein [Bosea sp. (in: a-proteobacteria)]
MIHQVGFEAGELTQPITYGLVEPGYDVVCMGARQVAAARSVDETRRIVSSRCLVRSGSLETL